MNKAPRYTLILYGVRTEHDDLVGRSICIENEIEDDSDPIRHPHPKNPAIVTAWPTGRRRLIIDGRVVCDYGMEAYWSVERTAGEA